MGEFLWLHYFIFPVFSPSGELKHENQFSKTTLNRNDGKKTSLFMYQFLFLNNASARLKITTGTVFRCFADVVLISLFFVVFSFCIFKIIPRPAYWWYKKPVLVMNKAAKSFWYQSFCSTWLGCKCNNFLSCFRNV